MAIPQSTSELSSVTTHPKIASILRLRKLSGLLDNAIAIPGTNFRFGLDPILGLLPGAGDFVGTALSAYIIIEAARIGIPKNTLGKMVFNLVLESVIGVVPVVGDLFDFAWKANIKNIELMEAHLSVPQGSEKANRWTFFLLVAGLLIFGVGLLALSVIVIRLLLNAING